MRVVIIYNNKRYFVDVDDGQTGGDLKDKIRNRFSITDTSSVDTQVLSLRYDGADIEDGWVLSDMSIRTCDVIRVTYKNEVTPVLHVRCRYNDDTVSILEQLNIASTSVADIRERVSKKIGIPVSVFRLINKSGQPMFDSHVLSDYDVRTGDTIGLEVWDGWGDMLNLASLGFSTRVIRQLSHNEFVAKFQIKVALYVAAHYGHVDLASTMMKKGARPDEPIGEHPFKSWCTDDWHPMCARTTVHEATESGQIGLLRMFVSNNICSLFVTDGKGLLPINLALRSKLKQCSQFLISKQWTRLNLDDKKTMSYAIYARIVRWADRGRERALQRHGHHKTTLKRKPFNKNGLLGAGVVVDGHHKNRMNSRDIALQRVEEEVKPRPAFPQEVDLYEDDPESYFRAMTALQTMNGLMAKSKGKSKFGKMARQSLVLPSTAVKTTDDEDDMSEKAPSVKGWGKAFAVSSEYVEQKEEAQLRARAKKAAKLAKRSPHLAARGKPVGVVTTTVPGSATAEKEVTQNDNFRPRSTTFGGKTEADYERLPRITEESKDMRRSIQNLSRVGDTKSAKSRVPGAGDDEDSKLAPPKSSVRSHRASPSVVTSHHAAPSVVTSRRAPTSRAGDMRGTTANTERRRKERSIKSALKLAKAQSSEDTVPLPAVSRDSCPRPFYHDPTKETMRDPIYATLEHFYRLRGGLRSRDSAIRGLTTAQSFRARPWLGQVRQAMTMTSRSAIRSLAETSASRILTTAPRMARSNTTI